jgi:hypothetical protein
MADLSSEEPAVDFSCEHLRLAGALGGCGALLRLLGQRHPAASAGRNDGDVPHRCVAGTFIPAFRVLGVAIGKSPRNRQNQQLPKLARQEGKLESYELMQARMR